MSAPLQDVRERFWSKVDTSGDCWEWTASRGSDGYGKFNAPGSPTRKVRAHRMAWELTNGPVPEGMIVRHKCDNPGCVRPEHLLVGTARDNSQDMVQRGRARNQRKTHCPQGHEYDLVNTYWLENGWRGCRACARDRAAARYWTDPERFRAESAKRGRERRRRSA